MAAEKNSMSELNGNQNVNERNDVLGDLAPKAALPSDDSAGELTEQECAEIQAAAEDDMNGSAMDDEAANADDEGNEDEVKEGNVDEADDGDEDEHGENGELEAALAEESESAKPTSKRSVARRKNDGDADKADEEGTEQPPKRTRRKASKKDEEVEAPAARPRTRRKEPELPVMDQLTAEAIEQNNSDDAAQSISERRRAAKEAASESDSKIAKAGATARSHQEVLRDARKREQERRERQDEMLTVLTAWGRIMDAHRHNRPIMGEVVAIEEINHKTVAILDVEGFRTVVPFVNFYLHDPLDYATLRNERDLRIRQSQMLSRTMGLQTPIMIDEMVEGKDNPEDSIVLGNRKAALELLNERYFGDGRNAVRPGDIIDGYITSVGQDSIYILVGGVEVRAGKNITTLQYVNYMWERFSLNQVIKVLIRDIHKTEDGRIRLEIDARVEDREEMKNNLRKIRVGGRYSGLVTQVNTQRSDQSVRYRLHIPAQNVIAYAVGTPQQFALTNIQTGDKVLFSPSYINDEQGYAAGRILRKEGDDLNNRDASKFSKFSLYPRFSSGEGR